jgi:hypothetical protein
MPNSGIAGSRLRELNVAGEQISCVCNQSPVQALHSDRNGQVGQFMGLGAG